LRGNWQDYYCQDASRGHSAIAELLVTYKMAAKINWHRYGTKLRNCHPTCMLQMVTIISAKSCRIDFQTDCSPPGYPPSCLLILVNWSVNWFACVHRIRYFVCLHGAKQLQFYSYANVANVTRTQLCRLCLDLAHKVGCHGHVP